MNKIQVSDFRRMFNVNAQGAFKTSLEKTKGQLYLGNNGKLINANRHWGSDVPRNVQSNVEVRKVFLTALSNSGATDTFLQEAAERLGFGYGMKENNLAELNRPLDRRVVKSLITDFDAKGRKDLASEFVVLDNKGNEVKPERQFVNTPGGPNPMNEPKVKFSFNEMRQAEENSVIGNGEKKFVNTPKPLEDDNAQVETEDVNKNPYAEDENPYAEDFKKDISDFPSLNQVKKDDDKNVDLQEKKFVNTPSAPIADQVEEEDENEFSLFNPKNQVVKDEDENEFSLFNPKNQI